MAHRTQPQTSQTRQALLNKSANDVIGIDASSYVSGGVGNAIIGGGLNIITEYPGTTDPPTHSSIIVGSSNRIEGARFCSILAGSACYIREPVDAVAFSVIVGGSLNTIQPDLGTGNAIMGGSGMSVIGTLTHDSVTVGGNFNSVRSSFCAAAGGRFNLLEAGSDHSFFGGGLSNSITNSERSSAVGGQSNTILNMDDVIMLGCSSKTATAALTTHVEKLAIMSIPTSSAGLATGTVWRNGTVLNIV